jgi:hypothetical protein
MSNNFHPSYGWKAAFCNERCLLGEIFLIFIISCLLIGEKLAKQDVPLFLYQFSGFLELVSDAVVAKLVDAQR